VTISVNVARSQEEAERQAKGEDVLKREREEEAADAAAMAEAIAAESAEEAAA